MKKLICLTCLMSLFAFNAHAEFKIYLYRDAVNFTAQIFDNVSGDCVDAFVSDMDEYLNISTVFALCRLCYAWPEGATYENRDNDCDEFFKRAVDINNNMLRGGIREFIKNDVSDVSPVRPPHMNDTPGIAVAGPGELNKKGAPDPYNYPQNDIVE